MEEIEFSFGSTIGLYGKKIEKAIIFGKDNETKYVDLYFSKGKYVKHISKKATIKEASSDPYLLKIYNCEDYIYEDEETGVTMVDEFEE